MQKDEIVFSSPQEPEEQTRGERDGANAAAFFPGFICLFAVPAGTICIVLRFALKFHFLALVSAGHIFILAIA